MKCYLTYDNDYNRLAIIGTYESILDYILNPENNVIEFYKTNLVGKGPISIIAYNDKLECDTIYRFESARQALQTLENDGVQQITKIDVLVLDEDETEVDTSKIVKATILQDSEGLSWMQNQKTDIKEWREDNGVNQTEFAVLCNQLPSVSKLRQTDISKIERGKEFFSAKQWAEVKDMMGKKNIKRLMQVDSWFNAKGAIKIN